MNSSVIVFQDPIVIEIWMLHLKKFGFKNKMVWHDDVELPKK